MELADLIDPKKFVTNLQAGLQRLQIAWDKSSTKMRKALLNVIIDELIFYKGQVQIFYRQINVRSGGGDSSGTDNQPQNILVDLNAIRNSRKMGVSYPPQKSERGQDDVSRVFVSYGSLPSHNGKDSGWYIGNFGCLWHKLFNSNT